MSSVRAGFYTSLKSKKRIDALFKTGRKSFGQFLMLRFAPKEDKTPPLEVVFAVSRKLGDAHRRNLIKRRLREALYLLMKEKIANPVRFDLAILPKPEVGDIDFELLKRDLGAALRKVK